MCIIFSQKIPSIARPGALVKAMYKVAFYLGVQQGRGLKPPGLGPGYACPCLKKKLDGGNAICIVLKMLNQITQSQMSHPA